MKKRTGRTTRQRHSRTRNGLGSLVFRQGSAAMELVMATAIAIPIAGGVLFLAFKICAYVFSGLSGLLSMPFV